MQDIQLGRKGKKIKGLTHNLHQLFRFIWHYGSSFCDAVVWTTFIIFPVHTSAHRYCNICNEEWCDLVPWYILTNWRSGQFPNFHCLTNQLFYCLRTWCICVLSSSLIHSKKYYVFTIKKNENADSQLETMMVFTGPTAGNVCVVE